MNISIDLTVSEAKELIEILSDNDHDEDALSILEQVKDRLDYYRNSLDNSYIEYFWD